MAEILQYVQRDGFFHQLAPFTKILFVIVVCAVSIVSIQLPVLVMMLFLLLVLAVIGKLHREVARQFILIIIMGIIMIVIAVITLPNGEVIGFLVPSWIPFIGGSIPVTVGGIHFGIIMALRFAVIVIAVQLFVISTQPRDLVHTLEKMKLPIDYTLMFVIALRFIPTLQIEGTHIQEAQLARGYDPGSGVGGKIQRLAPIMIPLVSNSLARSNVLGLTIDLRGYRTRKRTILRERHLKRLDYAVIGILMAGLLLFVYFYFIGLS